MFTTILLERNIESNTHVIHVHCCALYSQMCQKHGPEMCRMLFCNAETETFNVSVHSDFLVTDQIVIFSQNISRNTFLVIE